MQFPLFDIGELEFYDTSKRNRFQQVLLNIVKLHYLKKY